MKDKGRTNVRFLSPIEVETSVTWIGFQTVPHLLILQMTQLDSSSLTLEVVYLTFVKKSRLKPSNVYTCINVYESRSGGKTLHPMTLPRSLRSLPEDLIRPPHRNAVEERSMV